MIQFLQMLRVPAASAAGFGIQAGMHKSVQRDIANSKILFELLRDPTLVDWYPDDASSSSGSSASMEEAGSGCRGVEGFRVSGFRGEGRVGHWSKALCFRFQG